MKIKETGKKYGGQSYEKPSPSIFQQIEKNRTFVLSSTIM